MAKANPRQALRGPQAQRRMCLVGRIGGAPFEALDGLVDLNRDRGTPPLVVFRCL